VQQAMTKSVNTVFYKMGIDAGPQRVVDAAHQAGIQSDELPSPTAGIALGDKEVRPVDMASAFATFAADGIRRDAFVVSKVTAADGRVIYDHGTATGQQAVPQPVARNVTEAMIDVASSGGIAPAGRAVAGKTGTVQHPTLNGQNKDAWMVGYTPSVSTAVWVGTDQSDPIKNSAGRPVFGRMLPGSIWQTFMTGALRGTPVEQFSPFVALGTPPGTATDESTDGTDENSDGNSDDEDKDKDKKKSDSDSSDSDHGSDGSSGSDSSRSSDSESDSGSGSGSGGSGSDDSSDEGAAFQEPRFTVPGLRNSQPVRQTSGQQPLAAGTPTAG
jgi:membrane peptidoglycan carboxypeptidase